MFDYCNVIGFIVVIECGGRYCVFYIGYKFVIYLFGICIDMLLNIFVCECVIVYLLDKDG